MEEKNSKLCPIMSKVVPVQVTGPVLGSSPGGMATQSISPQVLAVNCVKSKCELWDEMAGRCGLASWIQEC